jgi:hypothetical protein
MKLDDKEKVGPERSEENEQYKSFFELDEDDDWGDDLEDEEVREKVKKHKVKSMKEHQRSGEKSDLPHKRFRPKR